ncbi:MAG: glutamate-5-semialdehyde dehydrogenase [Anaerofustis stercorihominis]|nr:glutamate-5-semialdehyde dehydrogenase [Anaerofustis stercorihominis]
MNFTDNCRLVKEASYSLGILTNEQRDEILLRFADKLKANVDYILENNNKDLEHAKEIGLKTSMMDRLALSEERIISMADAIVDVVKLPSPVGIVLDEYDAKSGIHIKKVSVPIGVVGIIYEARPNVTSDCISLCIKSGNAIVLKGGKEAINSNMAIVSLAKEVLRELGHDENYVYLIEDTTRESTNAMMKLNGIIDVLIPRGGKGLIDSVVKNATVPVIETGAGNCHVFVDESADFDMALNIIDNAKTSRPSVCNAAETLLVHRNIYKEFLPLVKERLDKKNVELRGCEDTCKVLTGITEATEEDFFTEYNDLILAVKVVEDVNEAVKHIRKHSTNHSEAIITKDTANAEYFLNAIDSAAVYVNASTRFTDGGEFMLGAEIGISTQKLHARGPMGLRELTSYKYVVTGNGEIR